MGKPYQVIVNKDVRFNLSKSDLESLDFSQTKEGEWHIIKKNSSYLCKIRESDIRNKLFLIDINGIQYEVCIKSALDQLVDDLGLKSKQSSHSSDVYAPMPGLVLKILAQPGDHVESGDPLIILEAMKMENVIKSKSAGIVKNIPVKTGQSVEKNVLLIEIE